MDSEKTISEILETYELEPRLKTRIFNSAKERASRLNASSFDEIYSIVGDVADQFSEDYAARFSVRLDSNLNHDNKRRVHEVISAGNKEENFEYKEGVLAYDALDALKGLLDERQMNVAKRLVEAAEQEKTVRFGMTIDEVLSNADNIRDELERLALRYETDGSLFPARRTRKQSPRKRLFGNRFYGGNPLAYFEANKNVYGENIGRSGLKEADCGLYFSLRYHHQLEQAIQPLGVTDEERASIIGAYEPFKGNASRASGHLPYSDTTIRNVWRGAGLEIRTVHLSTEQREEVKKAYRPGMSAKKAAQDLAFCSQSTVLKIWKSSEVKGKPGP